MKFSENGNWLYFLLLQNLQKKMCNAKQTVANRHSQLFFMEVVILEVALECMFSTTHNLTANHDKIVLCYLICFILLFLQLVYYCRLNSKLWSIWGNRILLKREMVVQITDNLFSTIISRTGSFSGTFETVYSIHHFLVVFIIVVQLVYCIT